MDFNMIEEIENEIDKLNEEIMLLEKDIKKNMGEKIKLQKRVMRLNRELDELLYVK